MYTLKYIPNCTRLPTPSLLDLCSDVSSQDAPTTVRLCSHVHSHLQSITYSQPAWLYTFKSALKTLSSTLSGMRSRTLPIALDGTFLACLTACPQERSQDAHNHTPEHPLKYTPNCTQWYSPSLLDCMLPSKLSRRAQSHSWVPSHVHSQLHLMAHSWPAWLHVYKEALKMHSITLPSTLSSTLPIALDATLAACLTVRSQVCSQDAVNLTPKHPLKYIPNCTRWHPPSLHGCKLAITLSKHSQEHI